MNSSIVCLQDGAQFEFTVVESAGKTYLEGWQIGALYSRRVPFDPAKDDREACERKLIERTLYPVRLNVKEFHAANSQVHANRFDPTK